MNRRELLGAGMVLVGTSALAQTTNRAVPEAPVAGTATTQVPPRPETGRDFNPVVTLNGWSLPWRMNGNVKEFHLVAEPVERELAEGTVARLWGYNGSSIGPTIEAVEGDRVRIFVTNRLPEHTTVHWHGQILPSGM
ncbi:MAG: multicopper oxidase domain-containing protein, partial [Roseivivax sp.]|nr:multicopper oxidase domain-containing protein [Roseivivax sp.]